MKQSPLTGKTSDSTSLYTVSEPPHARKQYWMKRPHTVLKLYSSETQIAISKDRENTEALESSSPSRMWISSYTCDGNFKTNRDSRRTAARPASWGRIGEDRSSGRPQEEEGKRREPTDAVGPGTGAASTLVAVPAATTHCPSTEVDAVAVLPTSSVVITARESCKSGRQEAQQ